MRAQLFVAILAVSVISLPATGRARATAPEPPLTATSRIAANVSALAPDGTTVPVTGARIAIGGEPVATTDATGSASLAPLAVAASGSPTRIDVTISAPGLANFVYRSVPVYPGDGPILTPLMKAEPQFDDLTLLGKRPTGDTGVHAAPEAPQPAATGCSGWSSTNTPPNVIRVYDDDTQHSADFAVHTVDFQNYVDHVLWNEWLAPERFGNLGFQTESLRSGAMAVKMYGWYREIHPKWGTGPGCYDVDGSTSDQVWDPFLSYGSTNKAVADTWDYYLVDATGAPLETAFRSGCGFTITACNGQTDSCGQLNLLPAPGDIASAFGTNSCALDGRPWYDILLNKYYFSPQSVLVHGPVQTASPAERLPYFVPVTEPFSNTQAYVHWTAAAGVSYSICFGAYLGTFDPSTSCQSLGAASNYFPTLPSGDGTSAYYRVEACAAGYCSAIMAGGVLNRTPGGNDFYATASFVWPYAAAYVAERNYSGLTAPVSLYNGVPGFGGTLEHSCTVAPQNTCGPYTWAVDNVYTNPYLSFYATVTQTEGGIIDTAPVRLTPRWCNDTTCHSGE